MEWFSNNIRLFIGRGAYVIKAFKSDAECIGGFIAILPVSYTHLAHPKACRGRFLLFDGDAGSAGRIAANGQSWAEG